MERRGFPLREACSVMKELVHGMSTCITDIVLHHELLHSSERRTCRQTSDSDILGVPCVIVIITIYALS